MSSADQNPWYAGGLRFKCTGCGKCCTGAPGAVWINEEEIASLAATLHLTPQAFKIKYTRTLHGRLSLTESKTTYDCVFLKEGKCQVYTARPLQCRTYPFWPQNLSSPQEWESLKPTCEGISDDAPLVPQETIEENRLLQLKKNKC